MTRETKSYELKIYDQSLMRFEAAYDAFGSLKLEITDIDSANAHLLPLNLIVDQDEKSLASWMEGRTIPKNRAFVEQILSTAGLTRNDILGILDVSKGLSINDSYWLDDGKSDVTFDGINLFDNRFDEVLGLVAYTGYTPSQKHKAGVSSEWTLGGQFPKAVRRINDRLLLFKTGSGARNLGKEPYSEYFAAQVAKRMGIDHVSYDLEMWKGKLASVCGLMNDKEISFVPFFVAAGDASFPAALSILNELDPKIASKNYLNMDKAEMTRQVTEVMLGKMREVIGQMDLKELMRDRESFNHKVFEGSRDDLANLGLELRTFNVQDFSDSQGIIRSMGADQAAEIKKEAELAQIRAEQEVAERQNQLDLKKAELKKTADKAAAEADMVKQTVTAEKQRELYVAQQEAQIAAETKKVELAERQVAVKERELDATVRKQAEADRYAAEQKADAELYTRTKNAEAAKVEAQNKSDADLYSAQKTAEGVSAKAKAEAEATRLKGEADGAAEKAHGEGVAAGIKAQTEAYNGMENAYLLVNRYIDVMPEVAEAVAKPLTAVDSIKMYGDGNATKLVRDTTGMVDQVTSGLKDATGIDLTELLSSFHQPFQPREDNE